MPMADRHAQEDRPHLEKGNLRRRGCLGGRGAVSARIGRTCRGGNNCECLGVGLVNILLRCSTSALCFLLSVTVLRGQANVSGSDAGSGAQAAPAATEGKSADGQSKDDSGYTLHVNVKLVNVFTNVTDATGAIVGGL